LQYRSIAAIGKFLKVPLNDLGIIRKFNGVNVLQTRWYIKISCQDYILKILTAHAWLDLNASSRQPSPTMRSDSTNQQQLGLELAERPTSPQQQHTIEDQTGFSYCTAIGELKFALVPARSEISMATTKLSQYGTNPAYIHYQAIRTVFAFPNNTRDDGMWIYWRTKPRPDLPEGPIPQPYISPTDALPLIPSSSPTVPQGFSDSDWGSDLLIDALSVECSSCSLALPLSTRQNIKSRRIVNY
jgi:hypothetical protein